MTDEALLVPPTHIPKIYPLCPRCGHACKTIVSQPYADGYHRRHRCRDSGCGHSFYTLAPYDGSPAQSSSYQFKDRPMTQADIDMREKWWEQYTFGEFQQVELDITERMRLAVLKPEEKRDDIDKFLAEMCTQITNAVKEMEE